MHGSAWWWLRHSKLDAPTIFQNRSNQKLPYLPRQSLSAWPAAARSYIPKLYNGKNKTFWYFTWEERTSSETPTWAGPDRRYRASNGKTATSLTCSSSATTTSLRSRDDRGGAARPLQPAPVPGQHHPEPAGSPGRQRTFSRLYPRPISRAGPMAGTTSFTPSRQRRVSTGPRSAAWIMRSARRTACSCASTVTSGRKTRTAASATT